MESLANTSPDLLIEWVQKPLTPDLLKGRWKKQSHPLEGHCYVAAESLWWLLGCVDWTPYCASYQDEGGKATHWWLVNKQTRKIADPTKEQYLPDEPPYHLGRGNGFLTKKPCKRAQIVVERVYGLANTLRRQARQSPLKGASAAAR